MRLLIVEDEPQTAELIKALLEPCRWETQHVSTLQQARAHAQQDHPDIILLDLGLPGSTVVQVMQSIRELAARSAVVILTGYLDQTAKAKALQNGAHACLDKECLADGKAFIKAIRSAWEEFVISQSDEYSGERVRREISDGEMEMLRCLPNTLEKVDQMHEMLFVGRGNESPSILETLAVVCNDMKSLKSNANNRMLVFVLAAVVQIAVAVIAAYTHQPIPTFNPPGSTSP